MRHTTRPNWAEEKGVISMLMEGQPVSATPELHAVADDIRAVFAHYRARHPRAFPAPKSTSKEWSAIAARMREGFSLDDLRAAIDGCHMTPHNLGEIITAACAIIDRPSISVDELVTYIPGPDFPTGGVSSAGR